MTDLIKIQPDAAVHAEPSARYNSVAILLHWVMAAAIVGMLLMGIVMDDLQDPAWKAILYPLHKSIGITILLLSLLRLGWRLAHRPPPLPQGSQLWEKMAARLTHAGFYLLMIAMPLSGWAMSSAFSGGKPMLLYGLIPWPSLPGLDGGGVEEQKALAKQFYELHELLANALWLLLALHVGAALMHHFWRRDEVLLRMTPRWSAPLLRRLRRESD